MASPERVNESPIRFCPNVRSPIPLGKILGEGKGARVVGGGPRGIKGFIETSFLDWPGRICAVIFLGGCNFRCPYCHNPDLVLRPNELQEIPLERILEKLEAWRGWLDGVCVTGGEPTLNPELPVILRRIRERGWEIKLDTNGSRPQVLRALAEEGLVQAVSLDLKAPLRKEAYGRCAGVDPPLEEIRESISFLLRGFLNVEFRTTVVPGLLTAQDLREIAGLLTPESRYVLQGFRPNKTLDPEFQNLAPSPRELLDELQEMVKRELGVHNQDARPKKGVSSPRPPWA